MSPTIDTASTALVAIDLQAGIVAGPTAPHAAPDVIARTAALAGAVRAAGRPVVWVRVDSSPAGRNDATGSGPRKQFPQEALAFASGVEVHDGDHVVTKHSWGAFHGTGLAEILRSAGTTQVILTGVATSVGVESTARSALDLGLHVVLAEDAMADRTSQAHAYSVERIFPRLGQVGSTEDILAALTD